METVESRDGTTLAFERTGSGPGTETFPFMIEVAETLAAELPEALCLVVDGADHEAGPELVGPPVKAFLGG